MIDFIELMIASFIALIATFFLTFLVKKIALKWQVVDIPNKRKIHKHVTPGMGGVAIFLGAALGLLYLQPEHIHLPSIIIGSIVIVVTGVLDDKYDIRPIIKLSGQIIAALVLISSGMIIEKLTLPFVGMVELGFLGIPITLLWIVGITNAINLIDGLDGLATGVSTIGLLSMFVMAIVDFQLFAAYLCIVLIGANLGFLYHNFYPAKVYMGDTGSNFLGYMIAVISILGLFKNIALLGFVIPVIILAVPIFETLFSIIRRMVNKQHVMQPDNKHIHYQLLRSGLSHPQTVIVLYAFSFLFGVLAILFSEATVGVAIGVGLVIIILIHILAEFAGLVFGGRRPVVDSITAIFKKNRRQKKR